MARAGRASASLACATPRTPTQLIPGATVTAAATAAAVRAPPRRREAGIWGRSKRRWRKLKKTGRSEAEVVRLGSHMKAHPSVDFQTHRVDQVMQVVQQGTSLQLG